MSAVAIALVCLLAVGLGAVMVWQRVWQADHAVLIGELGQRLERERRRREPGVPPARRVRALAWVAELRDLERQLVITGRDPDVMRWLGVQLARAGALAAVLLLLNLLWLGVNGSLALDWAWVGVGCSRSWFRRWAAIWSCALLCVACATSSAEHFGTCSSCWR